MDLITNVGAYYHKKLRLSTKLYTLKPNYTIIPPVRAEYCIE